VPGDAKQVGRIHIPQAEILQAGHDLGRYLGRVLLLRKGGQDDAALAGAPHRLLQHVGMNLINDFHDAESLRSLFDDEYEARAERPCQTTQNRDSRPP
jgi:hypothetical protein